MKTIQEAKALLNNKYRTGVNCPCCGSLVKMYRRKFNVGMARDLLHLYKAKIWIKGFRYGSELPRLIWWKLMERNSGNKERGNVMYRITEKGQAFVEGRITIASHALVLLGDLKGFEGKPLAFKKALGSKFDMTELTACLPKPGQQEIF